MDPCRPVLAHVVPVEALVRLVVVLGPARHKGEAAPRCFGHRLCSAVPVGALARGGDHVCLREAQTKTERCCQIVGEVFFSDFFLTEISSFCHVVTGRRYMGTTLFGTLETTRVESDRLESNEGIFVRVPIVQVFSGISRVEDRHRKTKKSEAKEAMHRHQQVRFGRIEKVLGVRAKGHCKALLTVSNPSLYIVLFFENEA